MGKAEDSSGASDLGILAWGIGVGIVVVALLVAAYAIGATKGEADAKREAAGTSRTPETSTAPAATGAGAVDKAVVALFSSTCGGCHTLAVAGTTGNVGPNLDDLMPTKEQVLAAIENGGVGSGQMPPGLLTGNVAEQVAELVSSSARK